MRFLSLILSLGIAMPAAAQPVTVEDALALRQKAQSSTFAARAEWIALTYYLQGVIEGVVTGARRAGPASGLCPSASATYDLGDVFAKFEEATHQQPNQSAADAVVSLLQLRLACED